MRNRNRFRRVFLCERLEPRCVLSTLTGVDDGPFHAVIVAGDPKGNPTDSPALRIDPNTTTSPFAGVGSLSIFTSSGSYLCTGTRIDETHVLTAAHCLDTNNNGVNDATSVLFTLNYSSDLSHQIEAESWTLHPDFTGFNRPSVNDDLAIITLKPHTTSGQPLPAAPTYAIAESDMVKGQTHLYMVGYGRSGTGVTGYTTAATNWIKRDGENMVDAFYKQDDRRRPGANEVFRFDFDGPTSSTNVMGQGTLGNDRETTLGGGDSGGPSFVLIAGADPALARSYVLAGVNTFTQGFNAPKFGSLGGGINLFPYRGWINGILSATAPTGGGDAGGAAAAAASTSEVLAVLASADDPAGAAVIVALFADAVQPLGAALIATPVAPPEFAISRASTATIFAGPASGSSSSLGFSGRTSLLQDPDDKAGSDESADWDPLALDTVFDQWAAAG